MNHEYILEQAMEYAESNYHDKSNYHKAAFANSVAYLCTGASGGYGGPSLREHLVSWALTGDGDRASLQTNLGQMTFIAPDGRVTPAGSWDYEKAIAFAAPICFGQLARLALAVHYNELHYDDAPEDLKQLAIYISEDLEQLTDYIDDSENF